MVRRKLESLLRTVHRDGIAMDESNRDKFFKHYMGWEQTKKDAEVWLSVLEQSTRQYTGDYKPLRHILTIDEMILCAIHALVWTVWIHSVTQPHSVCVRGLSFMLWFVFD